MNAFICMFLVFGVVKAYDFSDSIFNDHLNQIYYTLDNWQYERIRRNAEDVELKCRKPPPPMPTPCCAQNSFRDLMDKEREVLRDCFKEVTGEEHHPARSNHPNKFDMFSCEAVEKRKNDIICIKQCLGSKLGLVNKDGKFDQAQIGNYVKSTFKNEAWLSPLADQIIGKCLVEAENVASPKFHIEKLKPCKPSVITFKHCLDREIQLNCPADQIHNQESCERFRNHLNHKNDFDEDQPMMGPPDDD